MVNSGASLGGLTNPANAPRALSVHVVAAAACLIFESKGQASEDDDFRGDIKCCVEYLEAVKSWNVVASKGLGIIQELLNS